MGESVRSDGVRVAMIGAGGMANRVHYPSLASFDDVEIAAICDLDVERLNGTADRYGVEKRYIDYRDMVEDIAPDAVYAVGQPHIMFGQHLTEFCQRPCRDGYVGWVR